MVFSIPSFSLLYPSISPGIEDTTPVLSFPCSMIHPDHPPSLTIPSPFLLSFCALPFSSVQLAITASYKLRSLCIMFSDGVLPPSSDAEDSDSSSRSRDLQSSFGAKRLKTMSDDFATHLNRSRDTPTQGTHKGIPSGVYPPKANHAYSPFPSPLLPPLPAPSPSLHLFPSLRSRHPLIQLEGLGERCKLLQRVKP